MEETRTMDEKVQGDSAYESAVAGTTRNSSEDQTEVDECDQPKTSALTGHLNEWTPAKTEEKTDPLCVENGASAECDASSASNKTLTTPQVNDQTTTKDVYDRNRESASSCRGGETQENTMLRENALKTLHRNEEESCESTCRGLLEALTEKIIRNVEHSKESEGVSNLVIMQSPGPRISSQHYEVQQNQHLDGTMKTASCAPRLHCITFSSPNVINTKDNSNKSPYQEAYGTPRAKCIMLSNRRPATPGHCLRQSRNSSACQTPQNASANVVASSVHSSHKIKAANATNSSSFTIFTESGDGKFYTPSPRGKFPRKSRNSTGKSRQKRIFSEADKENISPNSTPKSKNRCSIHEDKRARMMM
ncbi:hypothetical protein AC1031_015347 [Aphanomyces cochlioides]|nr:hypothetical protein AC1031_015347 [Aphanomyces cochlioides]